MAGPQIIKIPAQEKTVCSGCEFHRVTMFRSGQSPAHNYYCGNPEVIRGTREPLVVISFADENIPETPDWCPFLNKEKKHQ